MHIQFLISRREAKSFGNWISSRCSEYSHDDLTKLDFSVSTPTENYYSLWIWTYQTIKQNYWKIKTLATHVYVLVKSCWKLFWEDYDVAPRLCIKKPIVHQYVLIQNHSRSKMQIILSVTIVICFTSPKNASLRVWVKWPYVLFLTEQDSPVFQYADLVSPRKVLGYRYVPFPENDEENHTGPRNSYFIILEVNLFFMIYPNNYFI